MDVRKITAHPLLPLSAGTAQNPVVGGSVQGNWMVDGDRIQTYAAQLRQDKTLRDLLLTHVALRINQQRLGNFGTSLNLDQLNLHRQTEKIGSLKRRVLAKLERRLSPLLTSDAFWEDAAIWILAKLNDWDKKQTVPPDCAIAELLPLPAFVPPPYDAASSDATSMELHTISAYAYYASGILGETLSIATLPLEALETLLGLEKQPISATFSANTAEKTTKPLSPVGLPLDSSLRKDGDYSVWRELFGNPFIEHQIIRQNPDTARIELVPGKAAWEIMQQFGPEAAYIFLIFSAHATNLEKPWSSHIQIKGSTLIKLYGWDKQTDFNLGQKLKRIGSLVELVCRLNICIQTLDSYKKNYNVITSSIWILEELEYSGSIISEIIDNSNETIYQPKEPNELIIRVRPGSWTEKFLNESGCPEWESLRQYGYLAKSALQINPYRRRLAAKLAIFLTMMSRMHPNGQYDVGALLKALESETILEEILENKDKRNQLVEQWDDALLALQQLGWEIKFDPETYPEKIRPAWSLTEGSPTHNPMRPSNWLYLWQRAKIIINPTTLIQHRLEVNKLLALAEDETFDPNAPEPAPAQETRRLPRFIPGLVLEQALAERGMSKAKLAEQLELDRSMVTRWIKGSRPIQPRHRELLWQLLGKELQIVLDR